MAAVASTTLDPRNTEGVLRLGIDGEALRTPLSGVGTYVHKLCRELERSLPNAVLLAYSRLPASCLVLPSSRWILRHETIPALRRMPSFSWLKTRGAVLCAQSPARRIFGESHFTSATSGSSTDRVHRA